MRHLTFFIFILAFHALNATHSPYRMEIYYHPALFAAQNDGLEALVPYLSQIDLEEIIEIDTQENEPAPIEKLEIIWANYHKQPFEAASVIVDGKKLVQNSGKISIGIESSIYCAQAVQLIFDSSSISYNRTFRKDTNEQSIEVELAIEWEDLTLLDEEVNGIHWQRLVQTLNKSFKHKIGGIITKKLLEELKAWYRLEGLKYEDLIYFVPHSNLMIELRNQLKLFETTENSLVFAREYLIADNSIMNHEVSSWESQFDSSISYYQIAIGKPLVEHLIQYAVDNDYFTYLFPNAATLLPGTTQKIEKFTKLAFVQNDDTGHDEKRTSLMCQMDSRQHPKVIFSEIKNTVTMPQKLLCGIVTTPITRETVKMMIKFRVEMNVSYKIVFDQDKYETVIKIYDIEGVRELEIISPRQKNKGELQEVLKELLEESAQMLRGKMAQLGSGIELPIRNARVYIKKDYLLFVGDPYKRLINDHPRAYFHD